MISIEVLRRILSKAYRAPSGDNCQPFSMEWDGDHLTIVHQPERSDHVFEFRHIPSFIALGCLLEGIQIASSAEGYCLAIKLNLPTDTAHWATVSFRPLEGQIDPLEPALSIRFTDRRKYAPEPFSSQLLTSLQQEALRFRTGLHFAKPKGAILRHLCQGETVVWQSKKAHKDLFRWLRFKDGRSATDGMPWHLLGVSFFESLLLRLGKKFWIQNIINCLGFKFILRQKMRGLLLSSTALICFSLRSTEPEDFVDLGRLAFRTWLKLNQAGFGVQPVSAGVLIPFYKTQGADLKYLPPPSPEFLREGLRILNQSFQLGSSQLPVWVFRTGKRRGSLPRALSPRQGLEKVLVLKTPERIRVAS